MKKLIFSLLFSLILGFGISSCSKDWNVYNPELAQQEVTSNISKVFGVEFPETQDWCTAVNSYIKVHVNSDDETIKVVQILLSNVTDSVSTLRLLNQAEVQNNDVVFFTFDTPKAYTNLFIAFINDKGQYFYKPFNIGGGDVYFKTPKTRGLTRALSQDYQIPTNIPVIGGTVESYANLRNWLPGEVLYTYDYQTLNANDYDNEFKSIFRGVIFNYFPNGRA